MARALLRLALASLRGHLVAALLTGAAIAVASFTLALSFAVGRIADDPWQRTFDATNGAHVIAQSQDRQALRALERAEGVVASTGAVPSAFTSFEREGRTIGAAAFAAGLDRPAVARPLVVDGVWLRSGGVVVEQSFARYFGLEPGDVIAVAARRGRVPLRVDGVAVTASQERYPEGQPGVVFVTRETLERIQPDPALRNWTLGLRVERPELAATFAARAQAGSRGRVFAEGWHEMRTEATADTRTNRIVLSTFAVFLLLASGFVIANQVGARVLARLREIGLLKAIGLTPAQVATTFAIEHLLIGLLAVAAGAVAGAAAAPLFLGPSQALLDAPGGSLGALDVALVAIVVELVVAAVTFGPTWRGARRSTMQALAGARPATHSSRLARTAVRLRLPTPLVLGAKDAFARRARSSLTALSLLLTVVVVVAALAMEASFTLEDRQSAASLTQLPMPDNLVGPSWDLFDDQSAERVTVRRIVYGLSAVLLLVALANLLTTSLLAVRERTRDLGILKAVGLTPGGVSATVLSANGLLALLAAAIGVPLGLAFFFGVYALANGSTEGAGTPAWWQLVAVVPALLLAVLAVAGVPARRASRMPVTEALRYE